MKFKVGDRVRAIEAYHCKKEIVGKIGTIKRIHNNNLIFLVEFDENIKGHDGDGTLKIGHCWDCARYVLEPVHDKSKIVITTDGKTTTAKLYDGKKFIKSAEANCSPDDKFDFEKGVGVAISRLLEWDFVPADEEPKFTKADLKTGMFVLMSNGDWGIIVGNSIIYENGKFDIFEQMSDDLNYIHYQIDAVIEAKSFNNARNNLKFNSDIIYRRGTK